MEEGSQITEEPQGEAMAMSRWTLIPRIVIYAAAVVFLVSLLVVGRTKPSKTATSPTSAKADLTVTKTLSNTTVVSGGFTNVTLRVRNPGGAQSIRVSDKIFPGFKYIGVVDQQRFPSAVINRSPGGCDGDGEDCSIWFDILLSANDHNNYITYQIQAL